MWSNVVLFVFLTAAAAGASWLLSRMLGGGRFSPGRIGGVPELDARDDFDRALSVHYRRRIVARLHGAVKDLSLPVLAAAPVDRLNRRDRGEALIPLQRVVGTVDGTNRLFDKDFRPTGQRARHRLESVLVARRRGTALPPIDVVGLNGLYYVSDGHHRVAAAQALRDDYIAARITDVVV